jgi:large subunit ribosomal protein L9
VDKFSKENISIPGKSIKRIGKYQASIRLHREVSTQLNFELLAEKK